MKRAVVLRIEDRNFAGYGWTWQFGVTRRKDGSFSIREQPRGLLRARTPALAGGSALQS